MENKTVGIILLFCSALILMERYEFFEQTTPIPPKEQLRRAVEQDILKSLTSTPGGEIKNVHHLNVIFRSENAAALLEKQLLSHINNKQGSVWLEVEVLDLPDEQNPGLITQTSVFDQKTKNKVAEFGATYYLKTFNFESAKISPKESQPQSE